MCGVPPRTDPPLQCQDDAASRFSDRYAAADRGAPGHGGGNQHHTESIFDNRFQYMDELRRMGADILVDGKVAVIQGGKPLTAAPVKAVDLRAGAALVIAGLAAKGTTEVEDIHHIERGYECIVDKLRHLGADIELVQQAEPGLRTAL